MSYVAQLPTRFSRMPNDCASIRVYPLGTLPRMSKDAGLRIRIDRLLRDRFLQTCHAQDKPAAQVIREFMREYVADHDPANDAPRQRASRATKGTKQ